MASLSAKIESILENKGRIILLANNPNIDDAVIHNIGINPNDLVVQFNKCIHHPKIKPLNSKKMYCYQSNHFGSAWGFKNTGEPERPFFTNVDAEDPNSVFAFSYSVPDVISEYLRANNFRHPMFVITPGDFGGLVYPAGLVPSLGFLVTMLCDAVRSRMKAKGKHAFLYCVGFSGMMVSKENKVWHDFFYEQHVLNSNKDIIRIAAA